MTFLTQKPVFVWSLVKEVRALEVQINYIINVYVCVTSRLYI